MNESSSISQYYKQNLVLPECIRRRDSENAPSLPHSLRNLRKKASVPSIRNEETPSKVEASSSKIMKPNFPTPDSKLIKNYIAQLLEEKCHLVKHQSSRLIKHNQDKMIISSADLPSLRDTRNKNISSFTTKKNMEHDNTETEIKYECNSCKEYKKVKY